MAARRPCCRHLWEASDERSGLKCFINQCFRRAARGLLGNVSHPSCPSPARHALQVFPSLPSVAQFVCSRVGGAARGPSTAWASAHPPEQSQGLKGPHPQKQQSAQGKVDEHHHWKEDFNPPKRPLLTRL